MPGAVGCVAPRATQPRLTSTRSDGRFDTAWLRPQGTQPTAPRAYKLLPERLGGAVGGQAHGDVPVGGGVVFTLGELPHAPGQIALDRLGMFALRTDQVVALETYRSC